MTDQVSLDTLLKVGEILSILCGGGMVFYKLGRVMEQVELTLTTQTAEITELKDETKKLGDILTAIAVQANRLNRLEEDMRELKHGRGFVKDLASSQ